MNKINLESLLNMIVRGSIEEATALALVAIAQELREMNQNTNPDET